MKAYVTELRWGLIFVFTLLLWMLLERAAGLHSTHIDKHMIYTNFFAIPAILVYVFALRDKKARDYAGQMSYLQGVKTGVVITLVVTLLSPLTQWVISTIITPDYFPNVIAYSLESGYFESREEAEAQFNLQNYMVQSAVGAFLMGVVTSLIVALFTRSRNESGAEDSGSEQ